MSPIHWKKFRHPAGVYRIDYPAYWDQVQKDEARSFGFGLGSTFQALASR
jgi:hypothetical protein